MLEAPVSSVRKQHDRSVVQDVHRPADRPRCRERPEPHGAVSRRPAGGAPVPDAAPACGAGTRARRSRACPRSHRPRRRAPARDVDLGRGPADPAGPRMGRARRPDGSVRRAAGRGGVLRDSPSTCRLTGAPKGAPPRFPRWRRRSPASWTRWGRSRESSPTRAAARSAPGRSVGRCSTASWTCRGPSRWSRRPRGSALTSSASWTRAGSRTRARSRLERRLEARVGAPPEVFDLTRFAQDLPLAALVVHDQDDARDSLGGRRGHRGGLARRGARDDAPARPSPHPPGSGGRRAGEGLLRVRARIGPGGRPVRDRGACAEPFPSASGERRRAARPSGADAPGRPPRRPRCPSRGPSAAGGGRPRCGARASPGRPARPPSRGRTP